MDDVNDNPPILSIPRECSTITEFHSTRDLITTIHASDADDPLSDNGRIIFKIVDGTGKGKFKR